MYFPEARTANLRRHRSFLIRQETFSVSDNIGITTRRNGLGLRKASTKKSSALVRPQSTGTMMATLTFSWAVMTELFSSD